MLPLRVSCLGAICVALLACEMPAPIPTDGGGGDAGAGSDAGEGNEDSGAQPTDWLTRCRSDLGLDEVRCDQIAALQLDELPAAAGNRYAENAGAVELGFGLFFDGRYSVPAGMSCATCHEPTESFGDGLPVPEALEGVPGARNAPSILNAARSGPFFLWDGRADSLWSQPLGAIENPLEMASSRLRLAHTIYDEYRAEYEALFGPMPALTDLDRFPSDGRPGDTTYDSMPAEDRFMIDEIAANVGKALEAYMRRVATGEAPLDRYLRGERDALTEAQRSGLVRFVDEGCIGCHSGASLSDGGFHSSEFGDGDDRGRAAGVEALLDNRFNQAGPFFDTELPAGAPLPLGQTAEDEGAFRTPTLRNIRLTGPYGHDGSVSNLTDLLTVHGGARAEAVEELLLFFGALTGAQISGPYGFWPR